MMKVSVGGCNTYKKNSMKLLLFACPLCITTVCPIYNTRESYTTGSPTTIHTSKEKQQQIYGRTNIILSSEIMGLAETVKC